MFRKVAQDFISVGWLVSFQRNFPQQEPALPNAYESNDRNVTGSSDRKDTTKVQQPETFSTQYIGASKFLFGKIQASESSGIAKLSLEGNVQFKKLGDIARLDPALCHSESQPVGFGANQQAVKNILAKGEKSDILSGTWGLMQNPISHSFREGEMTKKNKQGASENQQLETPKSENEELKDENQQLEALKSENEKLKDQNQQLEELKSTNEGKIQQLESQVKELETLKNENEKLKGQNQQLEELKSTNEGKIQQLESQVKELEALKSENEKLKDENRQLGALKSENEKLKDQNQQLEELKSTNEGKIQQLESQVKELETLKNENEKLKGQNQQLEELKSTNEGKIQQLESQVKGLQKELEDNKDSKPSAVNAQGVKGKVNYASASFMLSGVCAVGTSLATPYLAICAILAVAASVFLALGCHCLYKANTALSDVKVQQDSQLLLEK